MIEASGQAALLALTRGTPLQSTRALATSRTAIALSVIARGAEKKLRATRGGLAKTLPERWALGLAPHHYARPHGDRQPAVANVTMTALVEQFVAARHSVAQNKTPVASTTGVYHFVLNPLEKKSASAVLRLRR